jgi:hypothetical protein
MLSLMLAAVVNVAAPASGTYTYVMSLNGAQVGTSAVTVKRDALGNVVLSETESGSMGGRSGGIDDTLTLDPTLSPVHYLANASIADSRDMKSVLTFKRGEALQSGDVDKTYPLGADDSHFVIFDFGPFTGYVAFPAQMLAWNDQPVTAIVPMYAQSWPITIDKSAAEPRPKNVPGTDVAISISRPVALTMWYDPRTLIVDELDVPSEGAVVIRTLSR